MLSKMKRAAAQAAQNVADRLSGADAMPAEGLATPVLQYAAKMDRPGCYQKTWVFQQYDDVTAVAFALAGVAPDGPWAGWTINRLLRINYPAAPTVIPLEPPEEPA